MYSNMKITINGNIQEFTYESMTADELVVELKLTGKRFAIERNGEIMPKSLFKQFIINDGDYLEIVGAVGGG
jgi:sulfur carrier protein